MNRINPKNSPQAINKKSKTPHNQKNPLDNLTLQAIAYTKTAIKTVKSKCPTQDMVSLQNAIQSIATDLNDAHMTINHAADVLSSARVALYQAYKNRNTYAQDFTIDEWLEHSTPADISHRARMAYKAVHKEIHDNKAHKGAQVITNKEVLPANPIIMTYDQNPDGLLQAKRDYYRKAYGQQILRIEESEPVEVVTRGYPYHVDYITPETQIPERYEAYTPQYAIEEMEEELEADNKLRGLVLCKA